MTLNYKEMKFKLLQFIVVTAMMIFLFLPMFIVNGIELSGFKGVISDEILLFGNFIIAIVILLTTIHFVYTLYSLFVREEKVLYQNIMNGIVSLNSVFGLLLVTFTGLILNWIALVFVALMIISALIRYKFLT